jgi:hypothetical protein
MKYIKITAILFTLILCFACKKEASSPEFVDKPVIEAYLKVGSIANLKVSRLIAFSSEAQFSSDNLDNLSITITTNGNTYSLQPQGSGSYAANSPSLIISEGSTYNLNFIYNNKNVSATTGIPTKPTTYTASVNTMSISPRHSGGGFSQGSLNPDPVRLTWTNNDNSYYLVLAEIIDPNAKLIDTTANAQPRAFRGSPIQSNTSQISPRQFQYYGLHRLILFHLNPDYAALYGNTSSNSNNLTNSSSSVANGAGIFTGINSDTVFINILKP